MVVECHNHAFARWRKRWRTHAIAPSHILHVDEHHDMMDQRQQTNIANFMFHAMRMWPQCRVHWLVQHPIDSPAMWLEDETWDSLRRRFSQGPRRVAEARCCLSLHEPRLRCSQPGGRTDGRTLRIHGGSSQRENDEQSPAGDKVRPRTASLCA